MSSSSNTSSLDAKMQDFIANHEDHAARSCDLHKKPRSFASNTQLIFEGVRESVDRSHVHPEGRVKDVLVNFIILDYEVDATTPIILGRSFLTTRRILIDCEKGELTMRVVDQCVTVNVFRTLKYMDESEECQSIFERLVEEECTDEPNDFSLEMQQVSFLIANPVIVQCVPKNGGMTVVTREDNELLSTCTVTGWRICMDYRKLNKATKNDHFALPFIDQILDRLRTRRRLHSRGTYAFQMMPFGLCNAPITFQRCMQVIFSYMIEDFLEIFKDDFSIYGDNFEKCLDNLAKVLKRCEEAGLILNWEKYHFIVTEGIVLGHNISHKGIEVDEAKIEVIEKLPPPIFVKGIRSFLGHVEFYRRFIKDFFKISKPLCTLLQQNQPFVYDSAFIELKQRLISPPIVVPPDWTSPFELMCDASDFAMGVVLGQRRAPCGDHFGGARTVAKCTGNISRRHEMPLQNILEIKLFDVWGIDFMGSFPYSFGDLYILLNVDYVSKHLEKVNASLMKEFYANLSDPNQYAVVHKFLPITHNTTVSLQRMLLLHSILVERSISIWKIIVEQIYTCLKWPVSALVFPNLITTLYRKKNVPKDQFDEILHVLFGITKAKQPMLLGFKEINDQKKEKITSRVYANHDARAKLDALKEVAKRTQDHVDQLTINLTTFFAYVKHRDKFVANAFIEILPHANLDNPFFPDILLSPSADVAAS
ncbi:Detected protein of unknown function [Hibiscus syriacus]|uniref:Reverse transcriptase domain-containing protein n=1 Tax=Hibiscus syriacus TaxID=106335 RepID=A0A6A2ZG25_HIBSY|nr:Detected protein of unknown function [Hibiscus syriacus]